MENVKDQQQGFTLIELVVVIVILGILAAIAVPRFASFATNARLADINAFSGTLRSAAALVNSQSLVLGVASAASTSITMENTSVLVVYGYPSGTTGGINNALSSNPGFTYTAPGTFTLDTAPTPANCSVVYTQSSTAGAVPTFALTTTGC